MSILQLLQLGAIWGAVFGVVFISAMPKKSSRLARARMQMKKKLSIASKSKLKEIEE